MTDVAWDAIPPPLLHFIEFLQQSQHTTGIIKVPSIIKDALKTYINPLSFIPLRYVSALVTAIDHEGPAICRRMDLHTFTFVYIILCRSEEGLAHQRGLSLLAESFFEPSNSSLEETVSRLDKKVQIGVKGLIPLVRELAKKDKSPRTKKWMGNLALELVKGCDQNKNLLLGKSETVWRSLGNAVLNGECRILKLVAGLIMSEVWPGGAPTTEAWFSNEDVDKYAKFPNNEHHSSQWIPAFESYVDIMISENQAPQQRSEVFFAYSASIGNMSYYINDESAILVTVSNDLNVTIPASLAAPAQYIDISLSQIKDITIENVKCMSQSGAILVKSLEVLTVWTLSAINKTFYVNAAHHAAASIEIAFTSPMDATAVMNEITRLRSHTNEEVQIYQSQTIDVSQHLLADDGRLENPYKHAIPADGMIDVASQADVIPNYDFSTPVEPLPLQSINSTLQFDVTKSFMQWPRKTSQDNRHSAPTGNLVSTANDPIEIHQVCVPSLSLRNSQQQLEDMLEPGIESSIGWHQGAKLIETAPELRETVENTETERIALLEERTSVKQTPPKKQLDDEDNLYDATPKAENGNQIQNQQSGSVQHNGIDTQESVKGTSIPIKNGETNNTHGHVKISQQMRKNFEGPVLGSFLAAKAVVVEPADCRPVGKSKELSSENSSSPDRHQNESPPRSRHSKIKFGKKYPKLRIDIGNDDKNEIGSLHSEYIEKIQSSTSGTAKLKATGKADVNLSPKPRLRKTPKRSDRRKKNPPKPCTAVSSKQPTKKDINVRNSNMDDTNWEEVFLVDEDPRENPKQPVKRKPKKSSKRGRNIDDNAYSVKKGLPKAAGKAKKKNKSATLPGVQSANTRAAAMTANTKIQDLANTSNNHGDAQPNLLTAQSRPTKIRKQQNELSPIDSAGSNTETPPRMLNDSSSQMLQTKIGEVTTKRGSNFMRPKLPMLPPSIKEHHKARNFKELDGNQVCTSQISNRGDPPEVGQNPIPKNFQEERNQLDAQIDSPPNVTNRRRKNTIENSQSTEGSEFLSMRGPIPEIRPAPPPAPEQELLSERPLNFDNPDNLDEVQFDFFADATLFPIENGAIHEELTTRNAPRTPEPDFRAQGSKIPCTPQETSHNYDAESSIASKKTEAPIPTKLEVPVATKPEALATKLESALASVGSLHNHKFAPEAPMKRKPAAQPRKMQETPTTPHFKSEDKNQAPNEGTHGIIPSNHRPEAGPNARPKPIKTLSKISASEEHMISAKANPYYSIISDGHINQENQALTSKEIHVLLEPESSLEGSSLGGGYENENEPSKDKAMNSDEHCDPAIIIQHKLNSDRMARLLFDSEATHQNCKRGSDQTQQDPRKKIKSIEENKPCRRLPRQVINHEKTPGKTSPDINRKSNLISFGSNGPRNQGTITGIKERSHKLLPGQRLRFYEAEGNSGLKKKIEIVDRNCFGSSNKTLIQERAQTFISVPRTLDVGLRVAQRHSSSMAKEISHKPSSQSARVDMNGSPMPFVHSRHFNLRAQGAHSPFKTPGSSSTAESMIDGGEDFGIFDVKFSESPLLILPTQSPRVSMNFELNSSGTTKKGPSSPNEPRMLGELAPHSIHADGKLVNLQTATIVMPVKPPDPFLGVKKNQECGNSFMDLLRKSTNVSDKRGDNIKERPPHIATKMVDPDRTLVNNHSDSGKASRDKNPAGSSISSSSSSSSSSPSFRSQSQLGHLPNSIEESLGKSPWQKALQPHQRDTLDILCEVSHRLVANLIDKETAIDDLVSDYKRGGMLIIDQFEKARQQELDGFQTHTTRLKRKLITLYKDEMAELEASRKAVKKQPVADIEKDWNAQQTELWAKMDAALAACE